MFGQKLVLRILDTANTPLRIKDLALPDWMQDSLSRAMFRIVFHSGGVRQWVI